MAEEKIHEAGTRAEDSILIALQPVKEMKWERGWKVWKTSWSLRRE